MLYRSIRLAKTDLRPAAHAPSRRQIRIEGQRAIHKGGTIIKFANDIGKNVPAIRERYRVIPAQVHGTSRESGCFGNLLRRHPAIDLAKHEALRRPCIGQSETWIEFDRLLKQAERFVISLSGHLIDKRQPSQVKVVGI